MQRYLFVRFSSIGDVVLTTPLLRALRQAQPQAELHFLTKPALAPLLQHHPLLHRLWLLDRPLPSLAHELARVGFDAVLDLHTNLRSHALSALLPGPVWHRFPKLNLEKWLLTRFKADALPRVHIVQRYAQTLQTLGVDPDALALPLEVHLPPGTAQAMAARVLAHGLGPAPVGVVLGAQQATKKWLPAYHAQLLNRLQRPAVLLGGAPEAADAAQISASLTVPHYNAVGRHSLPESLGLLHACQWVLAHDTGLMHLAAAARKPVAVLWGNTLPAFGMFPWQVPHLNLQVANLACRPCSKLGHAACPRGHFACMKRLEPALVEAQLRAWPYFSAT